MCRVPYLGVGLSVLAAIVLVGCDSKYNEGGPGPSPRRWQCQGTFVTEESLPVIMNGFLIEGSGETRVCLNTVDAQGQPQNGKRNAYGGLTARPLGLVCKSAIRTEMVDANKRRYVLDCGSVTVTGSMIDVPNKDITKIVSGQCAILLLAGKTEGFAVIGGQRVDVNFVEVKGQRISVSFVAEQTPALTGALQGFEKGEPSREVIKVYHDPSPASSAISSKIFASNLTTIYPVTSVIYPWANSKRSESYFEEGGGHLEIARMLWDQTRENKSANVLSIGRWVDKGKIKPADLTIYVPQAKEFLDFATDLSPYFKNIDEARQAAFSVGGDIGKMRKSLVKALSALSAGGQSGPALWNTAKSVAEWAKYDPLQIKEDETRLFARIYEWLRNHPSDTALKPELQDEAAKNEAKKWVFAEGWKVEDFELFITSYEWQNTVEGLKSKSVADKKAMACQHAKGKKLSSSTFPIFKEYYQWLAVDNEGPKLVGTDALKAAETEALRPGAAASKSLAFVKEVYQWLVARPDGAGLEPKDAYGFALKFVNEKRMIRKKFEGLQEAFGRIIAGSVTPLQALEKAAAECGLK